MCQGIAAALAYGLDQAITLTDELKLIHTPPSNSISGNKNGLDEGGLLMEVDPGARNGTRGR